MCTIHITQSIVRVETYRTHSHVNEPDNAVRVTHIPTGLQVDYDEERSLRLNKVKALTQLKAILVLLGKEVT